MEKGFNKLEFDTLLISAIERFLTEGDITNIVNINVECLCKI